MLYERTRQFSRFVGSRCPFYSDTNRSISKVCLEQSASKQLNKATRGFEQATTTSIVVASSIGTRSNYQPNHHLTKPGTAENGRQFFFAMSGSSHNRSSNQAFTIQYTTRLAVFLHSCVLLTWSHYCSLMFCCCSFFVFFVC